MASEPGAVRFGVAGLNHPHVFEMTELLLAAGGELAGYHAVEDDLAVAYAAAFDAPRRVGSLAELLEDERIPLLVTAAIPAERAAIGIAALRHGKDVLSDKPAFTTLDDVAAARRAQAQAGRFYLVDFGERLRNRPMARAAALVAAGAIGRVLQTVGLGPHKLAGYPRPDWFFSRARGGGILTDIGSHQADHFLHFTGSTRAKVVAAQIGNLGHPDTPDFEDFGDAVVQGDGGTGYFRVDWFTPLGLPAFGDGRFTVLGTDGFLDVRKNLDLGGSPEGGRLFLVDGSGPREIDCRAVELPFGRQLLADVRERTATAMPQAHAFLAAELALRCELAAVRLDPALAH
jgi:predicted dehydrogenase